MKALLLYEPLLQYHCQLSRLVRGGYKPSLREVEQRTKKFLQEITERAEQHPDLRDHVRALDAPVKYLVDGLIVKNKLLEWRDDWQIDRLSFREDGLIGDEAFFTKHLDPALKEEDVTPVLAERMLVYYVALGLGFQGYLVRHPDELRRRMKSLLRTVLRYPWLVEDRVECLMPQAYQFTYARPLRRPPRLNRTFLLAGLLPLILSAGLLYWWMARTVISHADEQVHLREISESHQGNPWPSGTHR